jgi:3-isopropylmalate dehydrogenase
MTKKIAVLSGDGIGSEVIEQGIRVFDLIQKKFGHEFIYTKALVGAVAIDETGNPLPDETLEICRNSDAIYFGAIGDPKYDNDPTAKVRPEQGLLKLRKSLGLFANVRPIKTYKALNSISPLKEEKLVGVDLLVIRELTGGIYFGQPHGKSEDGQSAIDTCVYSKQEILRISKVALDFALKRKKKITIVDKANVLSTSQLWREVTKEYFANKGVETEYMYVDNASMQLMLNPSKFDVILTENMFGDILTDEASVIGGSLGMIPSASIGLQTSLYEPIHGSYPQAKGRNIANPIGTILSGAMMLRNEFGMEKEPEAIEQAVEKVIDQGFGTEDINKSNPIGTKELTDKILNFI